MNFRKPQPIRLVIVDANPSTRYGLRGLFEAGPDYTVIAEVGWCEAVKVTRQLKPDILILRLRLPLPTEGLEALRELNIPANATPMRVIVLAAKIERSQIVEALQLGARGVVLLDSPGKVLLEAVRTVMAGGYWVHRESFSNRDLVLFAVNQGLGVRWN